MRKFIWNTSRITSASHHTYCWTKMYTFFDLSVTPRRFLLMGILDSEFCVQSLWAHSPFSDHMRVVGCRLALVPLFAGKVGLHLWTSFCAYHLICQHDKLPLVSSFFLSVWNLRNDYLQKRNPQSSSILSSIFAIIRNRENKLFNVITQPWRRLGAILWFRIIIHHKLTKFSTHQLQVMGQHTDTSIVRARVKI